MSNLPKGWELVETGTVTIVGAGTGFKPDFQGFTDREIPFYKVSDMNLLGNEMFMTEANNYVDSEDLKVLKAKTFPNNTLIFPKVGAALLTNKRRILTKDSCVDNNIMTLTPIENKINPIFLYSLYLQIDFNDLSNDGALPSLNGSQVKKIMIPLPPLEEQKKIADILSTVDKKIAFIEENINATEELKKGLMQKLLTEGIGHTEFKDSELGRIPESWEVDIIENLATVITGSKDTQNKVDNGNYPFFVRSDTVERINTYSFEGEAVLTSGDGVGVGKIFHYVNCKFDYHQRVYNIHNFKSNILGKYFYEFFKANFYSRVSRLSAKNSVDSVRREMITKMNILIPPLEEQKQIAEILSTVDNKLENLKEKKLFFEELKKGLMQKLLTGEVRV